MYNILCVGTLPDVLRHKLGLRQPMIIKYLNSVCIEYASQCTESYLQQQYNKLPVYTSDGEYAESNDTIEQPNIIDELYDDSNSHTGLPTDTPAVMQPVVWSGYLYKHGRLFHRSIKRYYIFDSGTKILSYKLHIGSIQSIFMTKLNTYCAVNRINRYTMELITQKRSFQLTTKNGAELDQWINLFSNAILSMSQSTTTVPSNTTNTMNSTSPPSVHNTLYNQSISIAPPPHLRRMSATTDRYDSIHLHNRSNTSDILNELSRAFTNTTAVNNTMDTTINTAIYNEPNYTRCFIVLSWSLLLLIICNLLQSDISILSFITYLLRCVMLCTAIITSELIVQRHHIIDISVVIGYETVIMIGSIAVSCTLVQLIGIGYIVYNVWKALQ